MKVYVSIHGRKTFHDKNCRCIKYIASEYISGADSEVLRKIGYHECKTCKPLASMGLSSISMSPQQIIDTFCMENDATYRIFPNMYLINTEIGQWKITSNPGTDSFNVYHGNHFPEIYIPIQLCKSDYHIQSDITEDVLHRLPLILRYIKDHDEFRRNELLNVEDMPKTTAKQKQLYKKKKLLRDEWLQCKALRTMDKLNYNSIQ